MSKNKQNNRRSLSWAVIAGLLVAVAVLIYAHWGKTDPNKLTPVRTVDAQIVTKDLKGYGYNGKTTCVEATLDHQNYLRVDGGQVQYPSDRSLRLNYKLTATAGGDTEEYESGSLSVAGRPTSEENRSLSSIFTITSIHQGLTSCQIELSSAKK